jgi:hypothetical protein
MLRIYFLHHRELLGALSRAGYETVKELMAAAVEEKGLRPGMVSVVQTFGEGAKFHPHLHTLGAVLDRSTLDDFRGGIRRNIGSILLRLQPKRRP